MDDLVLSYIRFRALQVSFELVHALTRLKAVSGMGALIVCRTIPSSFQHSVGPRPPTMPTVA